MLTKEENTILTELFGKLEWPMDKEVFHALVRKITTIPIELCILDNENRVFTIYRKDGEYDGHHMPGTVLRDNETIPKALHRLLKTEVDMDISEPKNIGLTETLRGNEYGQDPTRHELSLIFLARFTNTYHGNNGIFSPLDALPDDTLSHHRVLLSKVTQYLKDGKPILLST